MGSHGAKVSLRARGNIVRRNRVKEPIRPLGFTFHDGRVTGNVLGLPKLIVAGVTLGLEQVAVLSSLLKQSCVHSVALFKYLLGGAELLHQAGDEGLGAGFLAGSAGAVEEV